MKNYTAIVALALALPAGFANAQSPEERPPGPPPQHNTGRMNNERPQGDMRRGDRPMPPPFIAALDRDGDGVISEEEISNAAEALRKLDKNHDGKLTMDELMPPPRDMRGSGDRRPGPPPGAPREGNERSGPPPEDPRGQPEFDRPPGPGPRDGASRGSFGPQRDERMTASRDRFMPLPVPREGFNQSPVGETRTRAFSPRNSDVRRDAPPMPPLPSREGAGPDRFSPPPPPPGGLMPPPPAGGMRPDMPGPRENERPRMESQRGSGERDDNVRRRENLRPRRDEAPRPDSEPPTPPEKEAEKTPESER